MKLANYSPDYRDAYAAFEALQPRVVRHHVIRARYLLVHPEGIELDVDAIEHEIDRLAWLGMEVATAARAVLLISYIEREQWLAELAEYHHALTLSRRKGE